MKKILKKKIFTYYTKIKRLFLYTMLFLVQPIFLTAASTNYVEPEALTQQIDNYLSNAISQETLVFEDEGEGDNWDNEYNSHDGSIPRHTHTKRDSGSYPQYQPSITKKGAHNQKTCCWLRYLLRLWLNQKRS